jgi:hypothetical protein
MKTKLLAYIAAVALLGVSQASAASLVGTDVGDITGVNGLVVNGVTYDVTFVTESYLDTYEFANPTFLNNLSGAQAAAGALAVVLEGTIGALGGGALVLGVGGQTEFNGPEIVFIPIGTTFEEGADDTVVGAADLVGTFPTNSNNFTWLTGLGIAGTDDISENPPGENFLSYAVFTPEDITGNPIPPDVPSTPLPATLPLFAGGLGFVGYLTRRKKRPLPLAAA